MQVFVLCSCKSGSSTIMDTCCRLNYQCKKGHSLSSIENNYNINFKDICNNKDNEVVIIDAYRTPIERKISAFFQTLHIRVPKWNSMTITELIQEFNNNFLIKIANHVSINQGFEELNIPKFKSFDFNKKYITKRVNNILFVKLLFKYINEWDTHLSEIFGRDVTLSSQNFSSSKPYYNTYKEFIKQYKIPKNKLLHIIDGNNIIANEFKFYNTKEEQKEYKNYWLERSY